MRVTLGDLADDSGNTRGKTDSQTFIGDTGWSISPVPPQLLPISSDLTLRLTQKMLFCPLCSLPKIVITSLLLPHFPLISSVEGGVKNPRDRKDAFWASVLGTHV